MSSYFSTTPPYQWTVHSFLNASHEESRRKRTEFVYAHAIDHYCKLLGDIKVQPDPERRSIAKLLLDRFNEKGRSSDQARARQWAQAQGFTVCKPGSRVNPKRKVQGQKEKERPNKRREPRVVIGTYVEGNVSSSTFNQHLEPVASGSQPSRGEENPEAVEGVCGDVQSVFDDPPTDDPTGHSANTDAQSTCSDPTDPETEGKQLLPHFLAVHKRAYDEMKSKLRLSSGKYFEDICYQYAQSLDELNLAHWSIIDSDDAALRVLFPDNQWPAEVQNEIPAFPKLPKILDTHIKKYQNITDRAAARKLAFTTDTQWSATGKDSPDAYVPQRDPEFLYLKYWIDGCFEHVISLTTESSDLLNEPLNEGSWEAIYYKVLDNAYHNLPALLIQRKEKTLLAHKHDPNPAFPYAVCYDGVVHTRAHKSPTKSRLEFVVIEVSRQFDPAKWQEDLTKLFAGCRAILAALKRSVDGHLPTMRKILAAGVLQAGPYTLVIVMTCLGRNMYYVKKGTAWEFPKAVGEVGGLGDLLAVLWKVREIARRSYEVVKHYHDCVKGDRGEVDRTGADFL